MRKGQDLLECTLSIYYLATDWTAFSFSWLCCSYEAHWSKIFYDEVCSNGLLQFCTFVISSAVRVHFWSFCCNSITCLGKPESREQEQETGIEFAQKAAQAEMTHNSWLSSWNRGLGLGTLFMSRNTQKEMGGRTTMSEWNTYFLVMIVQSDQLTAPPLHDGAWQNLVNIFTVTIQHTKNLKKWTKYTITKQFKKLI